MSDQLNKKLFKGKAILVIGPRQEGKTTIVEGRFYAHEMKWDVKRKATFAKTYSSQNQVINRDNFREFVKLTRYYD